MPKPLVAALVLFLLTAKAMAIPDMRAMQSPAEQCRFAIAAAERGHGIPPQLLAAIGRVESGRRDPGTRSWGAWPWTINAEGAGAWFETKAEAIQAVTALQARGVRSIDVGCMQVNLMHHPTAFANLNMAFEPSVNADYAARFLLQLHDQTGDWNKATADYHSANPSEGEPYAAKVLSVWPEEQRKAGLAPPPIALPLAQTRGFSVASASLPFPTHPPPRMLALTGMTQGTPASLYPTAGMLPAGRLPAASAPSLPAIGNAPGLLPTGTLTPGGGTGQTAMVPGRGLDFYRATPIRMAMPIRLPLRTTFATMTR